jgi:nicotinate-nucleotide pyrophosphorylase
MYDRFAAYRLIDQWLDEDIGCFDLTAQLMVDAGADVIMLDNMPIATMREAVAMVGGRAQLEASGGIRLDTIAGVAETGVDFVSTSRPVQSAPAVDIGLDATF